MTETRRTALVIEDEPSIRRFVTNALDLENWHIIETETLKRALIEANAHQPDLVILDLGLPDGDGQDFIRQFRQWSEAPIIILSARDHEHQKIQALDLGADDYLTKPFGIGELMARVRSMQRRIDKIATSQGDHIEIGDLSINLSLRIVRKNGRDVHLTPTEFKLLSILARQMGRVVTNITLLRQVWGPHHADDDHYLRIYMGHLRKKLETDPATPRHLMTETAVGYRLVG